MAQTDTYILSKQYQVAVFFGLIPSKPFGQSGVRQWIRILYSPIVHLSFITIAVCCLYLRITLLYNEQFPIIHSVADSCSWIAETFLVVSSLLLGPRHLKEWTMFWKRLNALDKKLVDDFQFRTNENLTVYVALIALSYAAVLISNGCGTYFLYIQGEMRFIYSYFTYRIVMYYQLFVVIFTYNATKLFTRRYEILEEALSEAGRTEQVPIDKKLNDIGDLYATIYDLVGCFNCIFGWQFFFIIMGTIVKMMTLVTFILYMSSTQSNYMQTHLIILLGGITALINMAFTVAIVMCCDGVEKSGKKITTTAFRLQKGMSRSHVRKELMVLAQFTQELAPKFTTAGFYKINQSTLVALFSTITTYVIVCIQFKIAS